MTKIFIFQQEEEMPKPQVFGQFFLIVVGSLKMLFFLFIRIMTLINWYHEMMNKTCSSEFAIILQKEGLEIFFVCTYVCNILINVLECDGYFDHFDNWWWHAHLPIFVIKHFFLFEMCKSVYIHMKNTTAKNVHL